MLGIILAAFILASSLFLGRHRLRDYWQWRQERPRTAGEAEESASAAAAYTRSYVDWLKRP